MVRAVVVSLALGALAGCGTLLAAADDEAPPSPPPPSPSDSGVASDSADDAELDGGEIGTSTDASGGGDATGGDASADATHALAWSCTPLLFADTFPDAETCESARLTAGCNSTDSPPADGAECTSTTPVAVTYCNAQCMQTQLSDTGYTYARTSCRCVAQP